MIICQVFILRSDTTLNYSSNINSSSLIVSLFSSAFTMTSVSSEFGAVITTTNHLPPISYGNAPRQCCRETAFNSYDWDISWLFGAEHLGYPALHTMVERPPLPLSPWVSPPLPEVCWPVVESRRGTPISCLPPHDGVSDYPGGFAAPSCQRAFLDVNNNCCSSMPSAPSLYPPPELLSSPFVQPSVPSGAGAGRVLPPFSCLLNPERQSMYPSKGQADINNNDIAAAADEQVPAVTSTPSRPVACSSEPWPSPVPSLPADFASDDPFPSPRIREILSDLLPRRPHHRQPLRKQFPELKGIVTDFVTDLIRDAMFGEGHLQCIAQKELESTTLVSLRQRLLEIVPGLSDRGISNSSVARLLLPLTTKTIRCCLQDNSAWCEVSDVLDVYDEQNSFGSEILETTS